MSLGKSFAHGLRWHRRRQGKSQSVVAGLAGLNPEYLGQIERGQRTPTLDTIEAITAALGVPIADLLGETGGARPQPTETRVGSRLHEVLHSSIGGGDDETRQPFQELRTRVDDGWQIWQGEAERYSRLLPRFVPLVKDVVRYYGSTDSPDDHSLAADTYGLLRTVARRINRSDLALLAAERGLRAAEQTGEPVRVATARWNLAHALLGLGEHDSAQDVARGAISRIGPPKDRDVAAITGALWLTAATARARSGDTFGALNWIEEHAAPIASTCGETNVGRTCFGPVNVAMHVMSIELAGGRVTSALATADRIDASALASHERRTTWALDLANGHMIEHDPGTAMLYLLQAEATGAEDLRYNPDAHTILRRVVNKSRPALRAQAIALTKRLDLEGSVLSG